MGRDVFPAREAPWDVLDRILQGLPLRLPVDAQLRVQPLHRVLHSLRPFFIFAFSFPAVRPGAPQKHNEKRHLTVPAKTFFEIIERSLVLAGSWLGYTYSPGRSGYPNPEWTPGVSFNF